MIYKKKQQLIADKTLREDPTDTSVLPSASVARTMEWASRVFSVGDMIVEEIGYGSVRFGIILSVHRDRTFSVHFPDGIDYAFAGFCRPYSEWLRDQQ